MKNNKVPTVVASVVLVAAIAVGVTFGVLNHKDNIETNEPFGNESSSKGSSSTISVPPIEDNSSEKNTSSEDSISSASETIETNSTPSSEETVSTNKTPSKTQTTSSNKSTTTSTPVTSAPVTSTPSNSGGGNSVSSAPSNGGTTSTPSNPGGNASSSTPSTSTPSGGNTGSGSGTITTEGDGWHLNITMDCDNCGKEYDAALDACPYCGTPFDPGTCPNCGRVRGDGHNGTCATYKDPFTNKYVCRQYD